MDTEQLAGCLAKNVDHGKCVALDEDMFINNKLISGQELMDLAKSKGNIVFSKKNEWLYNIPNLYTYSLDSELQTVRTKAQVFIQKYEGPILKMITKNGKSIKATKEHPLLINEGGNLKWKKMKEIKVGDYIAVSNLGTFPSKIKLKNSYLKELRKRYPLVMTNIDYNKLKEKTGNFVNFSMLNEKEFSTLRILGNFSLREIAKATNFSYSWIQKALGQKRKTTNNVKLELSKFFKSNKHRIVRLSKNEILVGYKSRHSGKNYTKFKNIKIIDQDIVKWFAFLHAEGNTHYKRIVVVQKNYPELLEEFEKISKSIFGIESKIAFGNNDVKRCELYSKPFIEYICLRFGLKIGASKKSPICNWILSLPPNLQALFLKYFFALECDVRKNSIKITQINKRNINIISTILHNFGIEHHLKEGVRKNRNIEYSLRIEGKHNLRRFIEKIGIYDKNKSRRVKAYLKAIKPTNPPSYSLVPINPNILMELSQILPNFTLKENYYYYANGKITKIRLNKIVKDIALWLKESEKLKDKGDLYTIVKNFKIPQTTLARKINSSKSIVNKILKNKYKNKIVRSKLKDTIKQLAEDKTKRTEIIYQNLSLLASPLIRWDKVNRIEHLHYNDYVVDLFVPKYHNFIGGFGGIVCHNSTLIEAISGRWPALHSEELKRGITIKLGYADATIYRCPKCEKTLSTDKCLGCMEKAELLRTISFVDAPGHETLMATVLAGASLMDGALLIIAANEKCPQPQTAEHLMALDISGIRNIIIIQNKVDLVDEEKAMENYKQIKEFVKGTVAENAPIIPVSAQQKINIDSVLEAIHKIMPTPERKPEANPKMLVVRSFDINKPGTEPPKLNGGVLGGAIIEGKLKKGDEIEVAPVKIKDKWRSITTKIKGLQKAGKNLDEAGPGGLVGVMTTLDPNLTKADYLAGSVVGLPGNLPSISNSLRFEAHVFEGIQPIKMGELLMINVGTSRTVGAVDSIKKGIVETSLKLPVVVSAGERAAISRRLEDRWRLIGWGILR